MGRSIAFAMFAAALLAVFFHPAKKAAVPETDPALV